MLVMQAQLSAHAETPEAKGARIIAAARANESAVTESTETVTVESRNRAGEVTTRRFRRTVIHAGRDRSETLVVFDSPPDIKGMSLFITSRKSLPDEGWIYLPALGCTKRVRWSDDSLLATGQALADFDMAGRYGDTHVWIWWRDEACAAQLECWVLDGDPVVQGVGYARITAWIDKIAHRVHRFDFSDRAGNVRRSLSFHDFRQHPGGHWRPDRITVLDTQNGAATEIQFHDHFSAIGGDEPGQAGIHTRKRPQPGRHRGETAAQCRSSDLPPGPSLPPTSLQDSADRQSSLAK